MSRTTQTMKYKHDESTKMNFRQYLENLNAQRDGASRAVREREYALRKSALLMRQQVRNLAHRMRNPDL